MTLVPNQRVFDLHLARAFQHAGNKEVLVAPAVEVLSRWVEQTSARIDLLQGQPVAASADRLALDQVWQQAVDAQSEWASEFETLTLARSARAAERLWRQWCPAGDDLRESPRFHGWRMAAQAALKRRHLFAPEDWLLHLQRQLERSGELPLGLPAVIELRGFVEFTRLEQSLLDALRGRGVQIADSGGSHDAKDTGGDEHLNSPSASPEAAKRALHAFDSGAEEMRAAADWAMKSLQQGCQRIAVVVNGLDALASQLLPVFDRVIHPREGLRIAHGGDSLYHLADSSRLSEHAVVQDALLLLRLSRQNRSFRLPFPEISRLLLSPHLAAWRNEQRARARFEVMLREEGRHFWSLRSVESLLTRRELKEQLPVMQKLLAHAGSAGAGRDASQALLNTLLAWGWPGPVSRGSLLAGRVQRFVGLLERLRQAGSGTISRDIAILSRWCRDTHVTERGGTLSPIQLLRPEDVVDQRFDAAWVMNVHNGNWPGQPANNPFLPGNVIKHIPRATPEGQLHFTRKLQSSLDRLAPEVHYSWSRSGDDVPRLASPLLATESRLESSGDPAPQWPLLALASPQVLEYATGYARHPWLQAVEDTQGLPLPRGTGARVPGGSAMVKSQSVCPLMAYLLHRLQLRQDPMPGPFADYAYRGKLLHAALYHLYQEQIGQPGLPAKSAIAHAVEKALDSQRALHRLLPPALQAEQQRLQRLLQQWLLYEHSRKGFVVAALETKSSLEFHGLVLDIRLDRIDRMDDGRQLIIDYKSGAVAAAAWLRKRIGEPQLPLYAVLLDHEQKGSVGGLALASVRTGDCSMAGVVDDPAAAWKTLYGTDNRKSAFGRRFANWQELMEFWQSGIGALLEEIAAGDAANCLYDKEGLRFAGLEAVLRRTEGEAWLLAHGIEGLGDDDGED